MHLASVPDHRARIDPAGRAISDHTRSLDNAEFLRQVGAAAEQLAELGIDAGAVIALKLTNRIEFATLLFAAWRIGATVTPVNPSLTEAEVVRQLADAGAQLVVVEDDAPAVPGTPTVSVGEVRRSPSGELAPAASDPAALALLIYTSGTTGVPKGVMLDHANLDAMVEMGRQGLGISAADRCLLILPLFHVNGIVVSVLLPLAAGASVVVAERFNPNSFFDTLEAERPTYFSAVPTIYALLAALPPDVAPDTSSVRFAVCGAAPASAELLERFESRYGFPLIEGYGLSEATCGSTINPVDGPRRSGTVGKPFPGQELRILHPDGTEAPVGSAGEVALRGANVMRGYLGRADETAKVLVDGWLRTGDVGRLDDDGFLTLVGRSKEMIIRGGENIYPKEIEDVLAAHPAVLEAAVIGAPDPLWGEIVIAYVELAPGESVEPDQLKRFCAGQLSGYKRPVEIHVTGSLPRNAVGKIAKPALRDAHAQSLAGSAHPG